MGASVHFQAAGLDRKGWSNATPIRTIFRAAFEGADLAYFKSSFLQQEIGMSPSENSDLLFEVLCAFRDAQSSAFDVSLVSSQRKVIQKDLG